METKQETLKRIEEEADNYGFRVPYNGTNDFYDDSAVKGYFDGAKSERNKVVDEMLRKLDAGYKDYVWYKHLRVEIESLKLDLRE